MAHDNSFTNYASKDAAFGFTQAHYAPPFHIWLWLRLHGVWVDGIVNDNRHRRELSRRNFVHLLSKYSPAFGIDLHIDDSKGVLLEGKTHGFKVLVVRPDDEDWADKVLIAVAQARQKIRRNQPDEK